MGCDKTHEALIGMLTITALFMATVMCLYIEWQVKLSSFSSRIIRLNI